ncbi:MAG: hypothetical protein ACN6OJ_18780 [Chryseobacterium sp.]|uniref:hypothetical protein n=1 Tax=Chryseobacterium sp. TaxID=1871047 RepID=UPI003D1216D6
MKNIEFIRRDYTKQLEIEYPDSVYIRSIYNYDDAIIGVTDDGRIVYHHFHMETIIFTDDDKNGYDYTEDFDNEDDYFDNVSEHVAITQTNYESPHYENPPLFCTDYDFLTNILPTLKENERSQFQDEMDDED